MPLPKDPYMLLSVLNMKLRDNYSSLDALCDDLDENSEKLIADMKKIGYVYSAKDLQFPEKCVIILFVSHGSVSKWS